MAANTRSSRRKRGAADVSASTNPAKLANTGIRWEWEADGAAWTGFSSDHNAALSDAFLNDPSDYVDLLIAPATKVRVTFSTMVQTNLKTGWQRDVRCVSLNSAYQPTDTWQWQPQGKTQWSTFPPPVGRLLEAGHVAGKPTQTIAVLGVSYEVNFSTNQRKPSGGGSRRAESVRRCASDQTASWEWLNEFSTWIAYPAVLARQFEEAREEGNSSCKFGFAGRQYLLHLDRMEQENKASKVVRKVQRLAPKPQLIVEEEDSGEPGPSRIVQSKSDLMEENPDVIEPSQSDPSGTSGDVPVGTSNSSSVAMDTDSGSSSKTKTSEESKEKSKKTTTSLKAIVDSYCTTKIAKAHVFVEGSDVWDAMLNQTNYRNNNNKFYLIQLLEDNSSKHYSVWMRWGRVGVKGQSKLEMCGGDLEQAKEVFETKFSDKTRNQWCDRDSFDKQEGKYDLLKMDYSVEVEGEGEEEQVDHPDKVPKPVSKLDSRLQALIELICDLKAMEDAVMEMKYDTQKAPLGKLTKEQIKGGYVTLKRIEDCIQKGSFGEELVKACDQFYTRIPHSFGMQRPPLIRTVADVQQKLQLLQALGDIEVAMKVLSAKRDVSENPVDQHYKALNCSLQPLNHSHDHFKMVDKYVQQTHGQTHSNYKLQVLDVYAVYKEGEKERFRDVGNRKLLWHGSRLSNWVGILKQGLRIAPPEAPVTGYMFGKGVYFADMCSKSANYCFSTKKNNDGILMLCDVSLGSTNDLLTADYNGHKLPKGKHSTRGLGKIAPDPKDTTVVESCSVPYGPGVSTGVSNPKGYTLQYNEYVVYDTSQLMMKYLIHVKFSF